MSLKYFMAFEYSSLQVIIRQILFLFAMLYVDSDVFFNVYCHVQKDEPV
jgi:hypothetical protein